MADTDSRIRSLIDTFVSDLSELVRDAALHAVRGALGNESAGRRSSGASAARPAPRSRARAKGGKRTPGEIEKMAAALLHYVAKNPGQGIEAVAKGMGVTTRELVLPAKKLLAAKSVRTKGVKRATRYFAT